MLPANLQNWVDETLIFVTNHPQHNMGNRRATFYTMVLDEPSGKQFITWLGIISARFTEAIYSQGFPEAMKQFDMPQDVIDQIKMEGNEYEKETAILLEQLANRMIEVAEGTITGTFNHNLTEKLAGNYYHTVFNVFDFDDREVPRCVYYALESAASAVSSTLRGDPLAIMPVENDFQYTPSRKRDTALLAMYAYAYDENDQVDFARVLSFWEWWLKEAIPQAWERATISDKPA